MASAKYELDKRYKRKDNLYPIRMVVCVHATRFYIPMGYKIAVNDFSADGGKNHVTWINNASDKVRTNYYLSQRLRDAEHAVAQMAAKWSYKKATPQEIKKAFFRIWDGEEETERKYFIETIKEYAENQKGQTKTTFNVVIKKLYRYFPHDILLDNVNRAWIEKFYHDELEHTKLNTAFTYIAKMKTAFNYAIDCGYTKNDPFRRFKAKREATAKRSLTIRQLTAIMKIECDGKYQLCKDIFLLSFYLLGINTTDLIHLKHENLQKGRINFNRSKTKRLYSIKVEPEAMKIIKRYRGENYLLSILDKWAFETFRNDVNKVLKSFFSYIEPKITMYWARHTWATIAAELDIPDTTISAALGHGITNPTTAIYVNFNQKKVDEANRKVLDYVFSKL